MWLTFWIGQIHKLGCKGRPMHAPQKENGQLEAPCDYWSNVFHQAYYETEHALTDTRDSVTSIWVFNRQSPNGI